MTSAPSIENPSPLHDTLAWCLASARAPVVRPISQWVEDEIVLPNGPFAGQRYRHRYHPASRHWFGAIDSGRWRRFAATAPTQNGKTLMGYVAPVLYHLFELQETVIVGLPSMDMANDKWSEDFLPLIEASRYREHMPDSGEGSRGGQVKRSIHFKNGATLRFLSGGGGDKKRAGYTARVLAVTETDGMDESSESSREADKIEQLEGRTRAFGDGARIYLECTVSIDTGRIWQEVQHGTDSRILRPCPHCAKYVAPERENLLGWQTAETEGVSGETSHWTCPACAAPWTEAERWAASAQSMLVHRGQEVTPEGEIVGEAAATQTFGLRWSAVDNPFATAKQLGVEEWRAARAANRENADRKMRQFVWCLPYESPDLDLTPLDPDAVASRSANDKRGVPPSDTIAVVVGVDTGKRKLHWTAIALRSSGGLAVIEYGSQTVEADRLGTTKALLLALGQLEIYFGDGWTGAAGQSWSPAQVWIDSGWHEHTDAVYSFCATANKGLDPGKEQFRPAKGYGEGQMLVGRYVAPTKRSRDVLFVGDNYHLARLRRNGRLVPGVIVAHCDGDHWKSKLHDRLSMPADQPDAMTLYRPADPFEHAEFTAHLTAEKQVESFVPGRGTVRKWERISRKNHWLDSTYTGVAASDFTRAVQLASQRTSKDGTWFESKTEKKRP
jgi:phage terminase large subunit GpA-like protein